MQTAGAIELGYASRAILSALLDELVSNNALNASSASAVLQRAEIGIKAAGNYVWVKGAVAVVADVRADLKHHGIP